MVNSKFANVLKKRKKLDSVAKQLKEEFFGIDSVIDEIIDSLSSWYIFPELQYRPHLICAWGLTGVGKTALVRRIAEFLNFTDNYYDFDFGKGRTGAIEVESAITSLFERESGFPVILTFDEFQMGRTISEMGHEVDRSAMRFIWELLDTGKMATPRSYHSYNNLYSLKSLLQQLLREGVQVKKGKVVKGQDLYKHALERSRFHNDLKFVPRGAIDDLYEMLFDRKSSELEVERDLLSFNGNESVEYINEALKYIRSPKYIDLSKSLIFILGNLDEAYKMNADLTADTDPDQFHKKSLEISLPRIKVALAARFRMEQIARLGNNHIIYPAFNKKSFEKIIQIKVDQFLSKLSDELNITIRADASLYKLIYNEGVFPTQGVRPVLSTIDHVLKARIGTLISKYYLNGKPADLLVISSEQETLNAHFSENGVRVFEEKLKVISRIQNLKETRQIDLQALVAVHESGHAVLSIILLNTYPEEIFSQSIDSDRIGYTVSNFDFIGLPRKLMLNRVAFLLGGIVAEELIYGKENITSGSRSDIEEATAFVADMIRSCGMGKTQANIQTRSHRTVRQLQDDNTNNEIRTWMTDARYIAESTLKEYKTLLLQFSNYLADERTIKKVEIMNIVKNSYPEIHRHIESHLSFHNYRDVLKGQAVEIKKRMKNQPKELEFQLNMDRNDYKSEN